MGCRKDSVTRAKTQGRSKSTNTTYMQTLQTCECFKLKVSGADQGAIPYLSSAIVKATLESPVAATVVAPVLSWRLIPKRKNVNEAMAQLNNIILLNVIGQFPLIDDQFTNNIIPCR